MHKAFARWKNAAQDAKTAEFEEMLNRNVHMISGFK